MASEGDWKDHPLGTVTWEGEPIEDIVADLKAPGLPCGHDAPLIYPGALLAGLPIMLRGSDHQVRRAGDAFQHMSDDRREAVFGPGECSVCWGQKIGQVMRDFGVSMADFQANLEAALGRRETITGVDDDDE